MDAKEEVMTTCLTVGAYSLMAFRILVVPMIAGSCSHSLANFLSSHPPEIHPPTIHFQNAAR